MIKNDFEIIKLDQSSAAQQVRLFNQVFNNGNNSTTEFDWLYKHSDNPLSNIYNVFGAVKDKEIIGINAFVFIKFQYKNKEFNAVQSCESAVNPEYRGQGVFTKIVTSAEAFYKELPVDLMFGFPNTNSYPAFMKMDWLHWMDVEVITLPCTIVPMLEKKIKLPLPKIINKFTKIYWRKIYHIAKQYDDINISFSDSFPFTDTECEKINRSEKLIYKKSSEVFKWMFDDNHLHNYRYYIAKKRNMLLSFFVVEDNGISMQEHVRRVRIIDWGFVADNVNMNELSSSFAKMLLLVKKSADLIGSWEPKEPSLQYMFKKFGFFKSKIYSPLIIKVLTEDENIIEILKDKNNWQPKLIDGLVIL